jgi:hypothetical protein
MTYKTCGVERITTKMLLDYIADIVRESEARLQEAIAVLERENR